MMVIATFCPDWKVRKISLTKSNSTHN